MSDKIVLNIITGPDDEERIKNVMPEFKPHGAIKDPEKKAADIQAKKDAFFENAKETALTGKIIGWAHALEDEAIQSSLDLKDEEKLLGEIKELFKTHPIVLFSFSELKYLFRRCLLYPDLIAKYRNCPLNGFMCGTIDYIKKTWSFNSDYVDDITLNSLLGFFGIPMRIDDRNIHRQLEEISKMPTENKEQAMQFVNGKIKNDAVAIRKVAKCLQIL